MKDRKIKEPILHSLADKFTEILIFFTIVFSPWAFGSTEYWSIWVMNFTAYGIGILLILKWIIRRTNFSSSIINDKNNINLKQNRFHLINKFGNILSASLMLLLLGYILISAINARASFNLETNEYSYFENINKIFPHSYDARGTWFVFWQYLGLVILFWGTRDWLAGAPISRISISLNPRLKRLFFVICLNGGVLSIVCIVQRFYYGDFLGKLLFLIEPSINNPNNSQFGPFAYRSNAASYLNLIWPISLGLFMQLGQQNLDYGKKRFGNGAELILIPCIILTACGPIISSARGGMFVMIGLIILASISMLALKISSKFLRLSTLISLSAGVIVAYYLGWEKIEPRLMTIFMDKMSYRTENYWSTLEMIKDYGVFGSGPGSFEAIAQFELNDKVTVWQSWVHNDYLEFYLTFGKPGSAIIVILILTLTTQFLTTLLDRGTRALKWFLLLSLIGVFIHAVADFPLQVLSILIPICIITSVLSNTNLNNLRNVYWH